MAPECRRDLLKHPAQLASQLESGNERAREFAVQTQSHVLELMHMRY